MYFIHYPCFLQRLATATSPQSSNPQAVSDRLKQQRAKRAAARTKFLQMKAASAAATRRDSLTELPDKEKEDGCPKEETEVTAGSGTAVQSEQITTHAHMHACIHACMCAWSFTGGGSECMISFFFQVPFFVLRFACVQVFVVRMSHAFLRGMPHFYLVGLDTNSV